MHTIYTWGYSGAKPEDLKAYVDATGAAVCDIRYSPHSRVPHWEGEALHELLGRGNYTWLKDLGNRNYKGGGPIRLVDPLAAAVRLVQVLPYRPIILVCACEDHRTCHRSVAADYLAKELHAEVEHLPGSSVHWLARKRTGRKEG